MQSICLEGLGGEDKVDPRLQETTFIQHTFGGRLKSTVLLFCFSFFCFVISFFFGQNFNFLYSKPFVINNSHSEVNFLQLGQMLEMSS